MTTSALALFRGSSRLEYQNQNIKLLRAVDGEVTRAAYRLVWVDDAALEVLSADPTALCVAVLVNKDADEGLPIRQLLVQEHEVDRQAGMLRLTFLVGPFIHVEDGFQTTMNSWGRPLLRPPECFVTPWPEDAGDFREADGEGLIEVWRRAIDFLTRDRYFKDSVFLRPAESLEAVASGPMADAQQGEELTISLVSYNPHLDGNDLERRGLTIRQEGALVDVSEPPPLDRDGLLEIRLRCLEAGDLQLHMGIKPDPHLSTYIPLTVSVTPVSDLSGPAVRVLGREWQACLDGLAGQLADSPDLHVGVLDLLGRVFPEDPYVLFHKGLIHYEKGELAEARGLFRRALSSHSAARILAWDVFAALKRGDIVDAREGLAQLDLSEHELFDQLLEVVARLPERTATAIVADVPHVFGEDKAARLLTAITNTVESESGLLVTTKTLRHLQPAAAFAALQQQVAAHPGWTQATEVLLELADEVGRREEVRHEVHALLRDTRDPRIALERLRIYGRLLQAEARLALCLDNARELSDPALDEESARAAIAFSLEAARAAMALGHLLVAEDALGQAFANISRLDSSADEAEAAAKIRSQLQQALQALEPLEPHSDRYRERLLVHLRSHLQGATLVILGGKSVRTDITTLEGELGVKKLLWLTSTEAQSIREDRIRDQDPSSLVVLAFEYDMGHLSPAVKEWLKQHNVPLIWAHNVGYRAFLDALRSHFSIAVER